MEKLIIYTLGFNQNYYAFTFILQIKIVLGSKFPCLRLKIMSVSNGECFVSAHADGAQACLCRPVPHLADSCITQLKAQGPSMACDESNED